MKKQADSRKSKLYCNRCGSFDLTKLKRSFTAKYVFDEPRKLHCQSCNSKLSFQQIASNLAITQPSFYSESDDVVLSRNKSGRPVFVTMDEYVTPAHQAASAKQYWLPFWAGAIGGLGVFGIIVSLFMASPYSKARNFIETADVYEQPIMRLGDVELLRLDNTESKNVDIELVLLDEPEKPPDDKVWDYVAASIERMENRRLLGTPDFVESSQAGRIQRDLDRLLGN